MLYAHEVIEYIIALVIVLPFLVFALVLYRKKRSRLGYYIVAFVLVCTIFFFIVRPFWIDSQIDKKTTILEQHLQVEYPDREWTIRPQNFREHKTVNPYYLLVDFSDDPNYTYYYFINRHGEVEQMGSQENLE